MKYFIFSALSIAVALASTPRPQPTHLLGAKECTWGPSYWCKNLTAAASCHATKHCIQTDWIHRQLPPDSSSICQTCLDMVKQARDQLLSNETQELIKEVFEGSCKLIHFKPIVKECDKIVDNFIPDLIDTLASEMNPQVVCSVAGLCNNGEYLKTLKIDDESTSSTLKPSLPSSDVTNCDGCQTVVSLMEAKFNAMSKDEILHGFLMMCRNTGSLSDACSNIILTYFTDIYNHMKEHLNPGEVCVLSGQCSALFHRHEEPESKGIQITPISNIGYVQPSGNDNDDLPCEFCEQLVKHLRDLVVANTTEEEFKKVMEALCKQTKTFSDECVGLVDEYYPIAYQYLVEELNGTVVCAMIGICPRGSEYENIPIAPLLPIDTADALEISHAPKKPALARVPLTKNTQSIQILSNPTPLRELGRPEDAQLPIDLLMAPNNQQLFNREVCEFCQFFLHYVQQAITDPKTEDQIKTVIQKACNELPSSINATCRTFVDAYEPALVALLAQEIDPSEICPLVRACPSEEVRDVDVFMQQETGDNSKCPLCLFAVQKLEAMVKDNKTEEDIKKALEKVCSRLPKELASECQQFVDTYTEQLVELLIADLNPQEVCVYLKLCTDNKPAPPVMKPAVLSGELETNAILDNTYNGVIIDIVPINNPENVGSVECMICKKVMTLLVQEVTDTTNEKDVIGFLEKVCSILPGVNKQECDDFVDKNMDTIVKFLKAAVTPEDVCSLMQLCADPGLHDMKDKNALLYKTHNGAIKDIVSISKPENVGSVECLICKKVMTLLKEEVTDTTDEKPIIAFLEKVCSILPGVNTQDCDKFVNEYTGIIVQLLKSNISPDNLCSMLQMCAIPEPHDLKGYKIENRQSIGELKGNGAECVLCKIIMQGVDNELKKHEGSIENTVRNICGHLPNVLKKDCSVFVRDYGDTIIQLLVEVLEPNDICPYLKLCSSEASILVKDTPNDVCYLCKRIVWAMSKIIENPKAQHDMKHVLEKTCRALPVQSRKQCQEILEKKGKDIYLLLIHKADKRTVCTKIGLCPKL